MSSKQASNQPTLVSYFKKGAAKRQQIDQSHEQPAAADAAEPGIAEKPVDADDVIELDQGCTHHRSMKPMADDDDGLA